MSRKRPLSVSNGNCDNVSRYDKHDKNSCHFSQSKSALGNSPPRIFIKPRTEASIAPNDKIPRRASFIAVPTVQQRTTRQNLTETTRPLPRRSSSLNHAANNTFNATASKIPRSSTVVRQTRAKLAVNGGDVGVVFAPSSVRRTDKIAAKKATRPSSPKNKENEPASPDLTLTEKHPKVKNAFIRKQSPLVPDDIRTSQPPLSPRKTFLLPQVDEHVLKSQALRPRRSTITSAEPHREKKERIVKKKASLPSLPTMVITHTPKSTSDKPMENNWRAVDRLNTSAKVLKTQPRQASLPPAPKPSPRPFLLPRKANALPSSSSLNSIPSLPSQVLEHTPLAAQFSGSSYSPCLSKARTKTIWTMLDEMKLIRSGGFLPDSDVLAPDCKARIVPLCKRPRNGFGETESTKDVRILERTPVRSSSTPYHLIAPSARHSRFKTPIAPLPPLPSLTHALANAKVEWEDSSSGPVRLQEKTKKNGDKYNWTLVDFKKPQRRSTISSPASRAACEGYGVRITTHDATQRPKPSLLTRAQTLMKFKFSGSKRVVGRGDPNWA